MISGCLRNSRSFRAATYLLAVFTITCPRQGEAALWDRGALAANGMDWCQTEAHFAAGSFARVLAGCPLMGSADVPANRDACIPGTNTPVKVVRLKFNVFRQDDGSDAAATEADVAAQVEQLNRDFLPWRIQFVFRAEFINSSEYRALSSDFEVDAMKTAYADEPALQHNVFVATLFGGLLGRSTFPWDADALNALGGTIVEAFAFGSAQQTLTHELGHALGLWHTHHGVTEMTVSCSDCWERADGVDGDITGDFCSDTAPTPRNFNCTPPGGTDICSMAGWGPTDPQNFMGYAGEPCWTEFSRQQAGRMHCWIQERLTSWLGTLVTPASSVLAAESCTPSNDTIDPSETVTLAVALKSLGRNASNVVVTVVPTEDIAPVGPPVEYGLIIAEGAPVTNNLVFAAQGDCGKQISLRLQIQDGTNDLGILLIPLRMGLLQAGFEENFDAVTTPVLPAGWSTMTSGAPTAWATANNRSDTTPNAAFAPAASITGETRLISPMIQVLTANAQVQFRHWFSFQSLYDGGVLEISVDGGPFEDIIAAGGMFLTNGYTARLRTSQNSLTRRNAWTGSSSGQFVSTVVGLPLLRPGQTVQLQWRLGTDASISGSGWYVDTFSVLNAECCRPAGLSLAAQGFPDPVIVGSNLTYVLVVQNSGQAMATNVVVTNILSAGVNFVGATVSQGACQQSGQTVSCALGNLPAGSNALVRLSVIPTALGSLTNAASVSGEVPDTNPADNTTMTVTTVGPSLQPDVLITHLSGPGASSAGALFMLTNVARNIGNTNASPYFITTFYLAANTNAPVATWRTIGSLNTFGLAPEQSYTNVLTLELPATLAAGIYHLVGFADSDDLLIESEEANNVYVASTVEVRLGIDIVMTALGASNTVASTGAGINVTGLVQNLGVDDVGQFRIGFYLSANTILGDADDRFLLSKTVNSLAANGSTSVVTAATLPSNLAPGTWYLGALADYAQVIPEPDETNNAFIGGTLQIVLGPDLIVPTLSAASVASPGGTVTLTNVVSNQGTGNANGFNVAAYLSTNDAIISTNDICLGSRFTSLSAGASMTNTLTVLIPASIVPGNYHLGVIADWNCSFPQTSIPESNENNNVSPVVPLSIQVGIDLVDVAVSGPADICTGQTISLTNIVQNIGTAAAGGFDVRLFLSTNGTQVSTNIAFGSVPVSSLAPNQRLTNILNLVVPLNLPAGTFYFAAVADFDNEIPELSEANNAVLGNAVAIVVGPDLTISSLNAPAAASPGGSISVNHIVANSGCGGVSTTFYAAFYLSTNDAIIQTNDICLGTQLFSSLSAGATRTNTTPVSISASVPAGNHYLGAIIDWDCSVSSRNVIRESNENNNISPVVSVAVQVGLDLVEVAIGGPSEACTGKTISLTNIVQNVGNDVAGNFNVRVYLSTNQSQVSTNIVLTTIPVNSLAPNQRVTNVVNVSVPLNVPAGTFHFGAIADYDRRIPELSEANNASVGNSLAVTIGPDLVIPTLNTPAAASPGGSINFTYVVANLGCGDIGFASSFSAALYLSTNDAVITTNDVCLAAQSTPGLSAGARRTNTFSALIPSTIAPGSYHIGMLADWNCSTFSRNIIPESDESNNTSPVLPLSIQVGIDLVEVAISGPSVACTGQSISLTNIVENTGSAAANAFNVRFYLSTNSTQMSTNIVLAAVTVGSLGPNQRATNVVAATVPLSVPAGTFYLAAVADYTQSIPELNEANNALIGNSVSVVIGPDLTVPALNAPAVTSPGGNVTFSYVLANTGCGSASGLFNAAFFLSTNDAVIQTNDLCLGSQLISGGLAAGARRTNTLTVTMPTTILPGHYSIGMLADWNCTPTLRNVIPESDESNNTSAVMPLQVRIGLDFAVSEIRGPVGGSTAGTLTLTSLVQNLGLDTSGPVNIGYYLSTDPIVSTSDTSLGTASVSVLVPGETVTNTRPVTIPIIQAGRYYVGAIADLGNFIPEMDEANNNSPGAPIDIVIGPNLIASILRAPSCAAPGDTFIVSNATCNVGTGSAGTFNVGVYLSSDATITTNDTRLATRTVFGLNAGLCNSNGLAVTLATNLPPGVYYIGVFADWGNAVIESSEGDNGSAGMPLHVRATNDIQITSIAIENNTVRLKVRGLPGRNYNVEYINQLTATNIWNLLPGATNLAGSCDPIEAIDSAPHQQQRFYRVRWSP